MPAVGELLKTKDAGGRVSPRAGRAEAASEDDPVEQLFSLVRGRHLRPDEAWPVIPTAHPRSAMARP